MNLEERRVRARQRQRDKRANDPGFGERERQRLRDKRATDPEYCERERQRKRDRYATDPEYREKCIARAKESEFLARTWGFRSTF